MKEQILKQKCINNESCIQKIEYLIENDKKSQKDIQTIKEQIQQFTQLSDKTIQRAENNKVEVGEEMQTNKK